MNTRKHSVKILMPMLAILLLTACGSVEAGLEHAPVATDREITAPLPTPATVGEAVLVNLRPLTTSGLTGGARWAPDGQALAYEVLSKPPASYREPPEVEVRWSRADGTHVHILPDGGHSPIFSADGRTLYLLRDEPHSAFSSLWAAEIDGDRPRELLSPRSIHVNQVLDDGQMVLSEWGTYAPLHLFDPDIGELVPLTDAHPSNHPQDARLSPDGTLLAYPKTQSVYLADPDGSSPRLLSEDGGFSARVWWSPNSRYLAYTTGSHHTDHIVLANRDGETLVTLLSQEESGYVGTLAWSPDSRWLLVATDAYSSDPPRPTHLYLFDTEGNRKLLLENYLHEVAWSPDGRTLALSRWDGPQGEPDTHNIWLADLTDQGTAAELPTPTPILKPTVTASPPLPLPDASLSPEEVIRRFWKAIDEQDYYTAWASLTLSRRVRQGFPRFKDHWQCIESAKMVDIQPMPENTPETMFNVSVEVEIHPDCDEWLLTPGPFTIVERETPGSPWLIESFNTGP